MGYKDVERQRIYQREYQRRLVANGGSHKQKMRMFIREQKTNRPCVDCGKIYPHYVMQFDHIGTNKVAAISDLNFRAQSVIEAEIAKCELVCANCHAERTWQREHASIV
jgi:hypothetical protein